jgi:hypothetical protein
VAQDLSAAREAGVRLILRFAYRPAENSETAAYCDPPLGRILAHLAQLGPILRARRDAIAYLEAGLIGPWGEWHSASPEAALLDPLPGYAEGAQPPCGRMNYDRKLPNRKTLEIVEAMLREVPGRLVAVRFPMAKAKLLELAAGGEEGTYPCRLRPPHRRRRRIGTPSRPAWADTTIASWPRRTTTGPIFTRQALSRSGRRNTGARTAATP